jgi:hypothetical protein
MMSMLRRWGFLCWTLCWPWPHIQAQDGWRILFNGHDLAGWQANVEPDSFTVVDGAIRAQSTIKERAHLFYVGEHGQTPLKFKDFVLEATVRGEPNSNSGVFFHTDPTLRDRMRHLANGYEVQLNNGSDKRKTGSLYAIVDRDQSPVDETRWFLLRLTVQGKRVVVEINDRLCVDYIEPEDPERPPERAGRLLRPDGGAIALQAHDDRSIFFFKDLRLREIAPTAGTPVTAAP